MHKKKQLKEAFMVQPKVAINPPPGLNRTVKKKHKLCSSTAMTECSLQKKNVL